MNGHMDTTSRRRTGGMSVMNMENIIGDPFALATVSIAMVRFISVLGISLNVKVNERANMVSFSWRG